MHFSIYIDQAAIARAGLADETRLDDWAIVNYLKSWWGSEACRTKHVDGIAHVWFNYRNAIAENPLWRCKTKSALSARLKKLERLQILRLHRAGDRSLYVAPGEALLQLDRSIDLGTEEATEGPTEDITEVFGYANTSPTESPEVFVQTNTCSSSRTGVFVQPNRGVRLAEHHKEGTIEEGTIKHTQSVCVSDPPSPNPPSAHDPPPSPPPARELYDLAVAGIRDRCGAFEPRAPLPGDLELIAEQIEALGEVEVRERIQVALATKVGKRGTKADWMDREGWTISRLFAASTLQVLGTAGKIQSPSEPAYRPEVEGKRWREEQAEVARTKKLASPELIRAGCADRGTKRRSRGMA